LLVDSLTSFYSADNTPRENPQAPRSDEDGEEPTRVQYAADFIIVDAHRGSEWAQVLGSAHDITPWKLVQIRAVASGRRQAYDSAVSQREQVPRDATYLVSLDERVLLSVNKVTGKVHKTSDAIVSDVKLLLECFMVLSDESSFLPGLEWLAVMVRLTTTEPLAGVNLLVNLVAYNVAYDFKKPCPVDRAVAQHMAHFTDCLSEYLPELHRHLSRLNIPPYAYYLSWVLSIFLNVLSASAAALVWDRYFEIGEVFRTAALLPAVAQ
jgi:hypothetical protein